MRSRKTTQREIGCTKLQVHRNLHCLVLLNKKRENNQYTSPGTGMYKWERPCEITRVIHRQNERTELNFGPQPMLTLQKAVRRCAEAKPLEGSLFHLIHLACEYRFNEKINCVWKARYFNTLSAAICMDMR